MRDKQQSYFVNIGSSLLLVIFLVVCLVTFAVLSLTSARSDYIFSERLADHKQLYYEASARAEVIVDEIDRILYETAADIGLPGSPEPGTLGEEESLQAYFTGIAEAVGEIQVEGVLIQAYQDAEACEISFQVPAGERQALSVALQVTDYRRNENYYEIREWKVISTESRESEQPLKLMPVIQE